MLAEVLKEQREFVKRMHGIAPNRVMLNLENAEILKDELRAMTTMPNLGALPLHRWVVHGMRVVEDPWAVGAEVGYVR